MKTINELLRFSNKLDFVGHLESDDYEKFNCIKKVIIDGFHYINSENFINLLSVVDDLHILCITQDF